MLKSALEEAIADVNGRRHITSPARVLMKFDSEIAEPTDPLFAAARGAALYARWRQEAPYDCEEEEKCEEQRQREREGNRKREL